MTLGTFTPPPHEGQEDTLKIRILESIACSVNGTHGPSDIVDWKDAKEAKSLIAQGIAEAVGKQAKKVETASVKDEVETAATS